MNFNNSNTLLSTKWILIHILIGFLISGSSIIAKVWCGFILIYGLYQISKNKNIGEEAALWSAYMAAAEVSLRACNGGLVWEIGKYSVILFLVYGMITEYVKKNAVPTWTYVIFALLIPGVIITFSWSEDPINDISFNASGIMCLLISTFYFYKRNICYENLKQLFSFALYPTITLSMVLFFRAPDVENVTFISGANFAMSGGFGPNQVATVLGFGWLLVLILMNLKEKVTVNKIFSYSLFAFILFRSLFTFSRGGNFGAVLAYVAFVGVFILAADNTFFSSKSIGSIIVVVILSALIVNQLNSLTGGVFMNRFEGKTTEGEIKEDVTTGRADIIENEYKLCKMFPLGVGVGGSAHYRAKLFNDYHNSHNEFGRLLSEHGFLGIIIILLLILNPIIYYRKITSTLNKAFAWLFFVLFFATAMHSGFRIALGAFAYGMSFLILYKDENTLCWK